jgi:chromosome segregation ATPase
MDTVQGKSTGRRDQMKGQIGNLSEEVEKLTKQLEESRSATADVQNKLTAMTTERDGLQTQLATVTTERDQVQGQLAEKGKALAETEQKLKLSEERLKDPAFVDAGKQPAGATETPKATGDAEVEALELAAKQDAGQSDDEKWLAQYDAAGPMERRRMWKERQRGKAKQ